METKTDSDPKSENATPVSRSLDRVVRRRRVRAKVVAAAELDATLCSIQDAGGEVYQILPFYNQVGGEQHDKGDGKHDLTLSMGPSFAVTYGEAS